MSRQSKSHSCRYAGLKRLVELDLPEGSLTIADIHPKAWSILVNAIKHYDALIQQSTSATERQVATASMLLCFESFLWSGNVESTNLRYLEKHWRTTQERQVTASTRLGALAPRRA